MDIEYNKKRRRINIIIFLFISALFIFYCWHISIVFDMYPDKDAKIPLIPAIIKGLDHLTNKPLDLYITASTKTGILYGLLIAFLTGLILFGDPKKTMFGKEHGSARWGTKKEKNKLRNPDDSKNIILTNDVFLDMNTRRTRLNNNVLIVGGSGSGKTRYYAIPNLAQLNCSYVVTDPKGELLLKTGKLFKENGYKVLCFNLIEKEYSCCYNPFYYIRKKEDVFKLTKQIIASTKPKESSGSADPFWENSEILLLQSIFFYIWLECPTEEQNIKTVMRLLEASDASEEDENKQSELDILFENIKKKRGSDNIACKQYSLYKKASGKTAKSILISCGSRLSALNLEEIQNLMMTDNLHLDELGDRKTILYIVLPDSTDTSFSFLASLLYTQLFDELYFQADFGELKWENNRILYKSKESLYQQKKLLIRLYEKMNNTKGVIKRRELRTEIIASFKKIQNEFGLPYPTFDGFMPKDIFEKYINDLDSCYLRLNNKKSTLQKYYSGLTDLYKALAYVKKDNYRRQERIIITDKIDTYKLRIEYEFGIKQNKESRKNYWINEKKYLIELKKLIKDLTISEDNYGTRQSFNDKCMQIEKYQVLIKKNKKLIKEASIFQRTLIKDYKNKIRYYINEIKRIENFMEYEFGITNTEKRMNGGRLAIHVRCILDEFANIPPPPNFEKLVATMRSREISVNIILQNIGQLKDLFEKAWESIVGNCDSFLFLGGQEESTLEMVNKKLGKMTIDKRSTGRTKGSQESNNLNWDNMGRDLLFMDEIQKQETEYSILFIRGKPPFWSLKYKTEKHKNFSKIGDEKDNAEWILNYRKIFNTLKNIKSINIETFLKEETINIIKDKTKKILNNLNNTFEIKAYSNNLSENNAVPIHNDRSKNHREHLQKLIAIKMDELFENPTFNIETISPNNLISLLKEDMTEEVLGEPQDKSEVSYG